MKFPSSGWHAFIIAVLTQIAAQGAFAQSADRTEAIWSEPQVRYLLADMTLNDGKTDLYRKYAKEERDPDSREAIRLWDAGARVMNTNEFERRWLTNKFGKDGRVMRIVLRGTTRTITGTEVLLTTDTAWDQSPMRMVLADLALGRPMAFYATRTNNPNVVEALRRWRAGVRVVNTNLFAVHAHGQDRHLIYEGTHDSLDGARVVLNSDAPWPETNVRYFMADIALGGSIEFYRAAAERDHEMGCLEAVRRTEEGYQITNLDQFERKKVDGKTLITRKGSNSRISGMDVKLSSDL